MTPPSGVGVGVRPQNDEGRNLECRQAVESFIDEILEQSFPASDAPAWGIASSRFDRAVWCRPTAQKSLFCPPHLNEAIE